MPNYHQKSVEQWIETIAQHELPAITSTAKMLDKIANDDVSSLAKLSEVISYDQALSSCVLKVSNSIPHFGVTKVATVSRGTIILGVRAVKNICLTSKLIDGLLQSKNLSQAVYQHIKQLMATSFYAGLLAKMMVPQYEGDTKEEVYLAAMLYRIGETAYWCAENSKAEQLIEQKPSKTAKEFDRLCSSTLGIDFKQLSKGLANVWNLGDLLVKALDQPVSRTVEVQIIFLANQLSRYIQSPPTRNEFNDVLDKISKIMKINVRQLRAQISQTRSDAIKLLISYNAEKIVKYLKPLPSIDDFCQQPISTKPVVEACSKQQLQLNALQQMMTLTQTSKDFNDFLRLTLHTLVTTIDFEKSSFLMLTSSKQQIKSRFTLNEHGERENNIFQMILKDPNNLISQAIQSEHGILINKKIAKEQQKLMTPEISAFINKGEICLMPVKINNNCIGVICAQVFGESATISADNFSQFCFLIQQLNMCLTLISQSK